MLRHPVATFSPLAPRWLAQVMSSNHVPVPWADMVRNALSVTAPVALGFAVGDVALGGLVALGAWLAAEGDRGGVFASRAYGMGVGVAASVVGLLLGQAASGHVLAALAGVAVLAAVAAVLSAASADLSYAGLQLLVYFAVGTGPLSQTSAPVLVLSTLGGAAWALALSWGQILVRPSREAPRRAVAAVLDALVLVAATDGRREGARCTGPDAGRDGVPAPLTRRLRGPHAGAAAAVAHAYDAVISARARSFGRRHDLDHLNEVLDAANGVTETLVAPDGESLSAQGADDLVRRLEAVRTSIASSPFTRGWRAVRHPLEPRPAEPSPSGEPGDGSRADDQASGAAMAALERSVAGRLTGRSPGQPRTPWRDLVTTVLGPSTRVYAVRLVITLVVAEAIAVTAPLDRSYWVLMTAALVLKPDYGSVFARGVQRVLGTLAGAVIGGLVLLALPDGPLIIVPVAVLGFLLPFGESRNYGLMATFLTPLVLVFTELSADVPPGLLTARVLDTVVAAVVVLLVGYLAWPSTWCSRMPEEVAAFVDVVADYAGVTLMGVPAVMVPARRRAQGALTDIRSRLQASLAEPTPGARAASTWFPLITTLAQAVEDLRDVSVLSAGAHQRGHGLADSQDAERVERWLRELSAAVRDGREPEDLDLPSDGPLAAVGEDLRGARRLMLGSERRSARGAG